MKPTNFILSGLKNLKKVKKLILLGIVLLIIGGCAMTVIHEYGAGYGPDGQNGFNQMVSTQDLGIGYDLVYTDPEDWAKN